MNIRNMAVHEEIDHLRSQVDNLMEQLRDTQRQLKELQEALPPKYSDAILDPAIPSINTFAVSVSNAPEQMIDRDILRDCRIEVPYKCCSDSSTKWKHRMLVFGDHEGYSQENIFHYVNEHEKQSLYVAKDTIYRIASHATVTGQGLLLVVKPHAVDIPLDIIDLVTILDLL